MTTQRFTPTFSAPASTGQTLSTESFLDKVPVALLFLPDPDAAIDTLAAYNGVHADFAQRRVQLLAVVPELASDARDLADRMQLTFPLLADPSLTIYQEFGAFDSDDEPIACSVIIARTGTVAAKTEGVVSPSEMTAQLDDLEGSRRFEMAVNR
jgi:peroxiredoxin